MQSLFRQTRTRIHSASERQREQQQGYDAAGRTMAAIQLGTQILLWIFFYGYDLCEQTVWQAVLMLLIPVILLFLIWRCADAEHPSARWWMLGLNVCLLLDGVFLTSALSGFIAQLIPHYPAWVTVIFPCAMCYLAALCARERGVRYGSAVLAVPLVVLLVFGTVFLRASTRADRMWPILGDGLFSTARSALNGAGAVWGVSLLFLHGRKTAVYAAVPWGLGLLCAVWFGFLNSWASGDDLAVAEKMMGLARHAHSVILYEMSGVLWMLLIPAALIACLSASGQLIGRAFPKIPLWISLMVIAIPSAAASLWMTDSLFAVLQTVLPWRYVISLICGLGLMLTARRRT